MAEGFGLIENALATYENQDPDEEKFSKVATSIRDSLQCYCLIYNEKKSKTMQTCINEFFKKRDGTQNNESMNKSQHNMESFLQYIKSCVLNLCIKIL